jgi:hypothetical protein
MDITNGKYIRLQKNDLNEQKLLEYLKQTANKSSQSVIFDEVGDDAVITLRDSNYTPSIEEALNQEYKL